MSQTQRAISSADLLTLDRGSAEWLVEQRLLRRGASLLAGVPGVGKRTLARDLALCVTRGRPWLGFPVSSGRVLYAKLGEFWKLRSLFSQGGLEPKDEIYFVDAGHPSGQLERIRDYAKSVGPALIIIDGLAQLRQQDACNRRAGDPLLVDRIVDLARDNAAHVLIIHDIVDSLASDLAAFVSDSNRSLDSILMLSSRDDTRVLRTVQRQGLDLLDGIELPPCDAVREAAVEDLETQILAYLRRTGRLAERDEIARHVSSADLAETRWVVKALHRRGELIRTGSGSRADPYRYTGFDRADDPSRPLWLRRIKPWARLGRGSLPSRAMAVQSETA